MAATAKDKDAQALDYVKTQQQVGAGREAAHAKEQEISRREGGADPAQDSPKRQGDKLEQARDAAAGRGKR